MDRRHPMTSKHIRRGAVMIEVNARPHLAGIADNTKWADRISKWKPAVFCQKREMKIFISSENDYRHIDVVVGLE